jgi:hypothetical protein
MITIFTTKLPESMTGLETLEALYRANQKSLVVLGMTVDEDAETVKKAIEGLNITYPIILADRSIHEVCEFAIAKPINVFPTTLTIIGNGGLMHEKHEGILSESQLRDAIESTKQHRQSLDLEPNILWADRVLEVSSEYSDSDWSAKQILGPPDTYPNHGDLPTAWASESEAEKIEFIKVGFEKPAQVTGIKIYETYNPGALERVEAIDEMGGVHPLWEGRAEPITQKRRILRIDISPTDYKVAGIVLKLNSQKVPGWNQIDAVGLVYVEE